MKKIATILLLLHVLTLAYAQENAPERRDSAIYQGLGIKVDVGYLIYELAHSKGKRQNYELAFNAKFKNRYYPTIEAGYAFGKQNANGGKYFGGGAFARVGLDFNLMKNPAIPHCFLVGMRFANALQRYDLNDITTNSAYWEKNATQNFRNNVRYDCWMEVVAGVEVQVYKRFYMGWAARLKILFTEENKHGNGIVPAYIPGFGLHNTSQFSFNYYLGVRI